MNFVLTIDVRNRISPKTAAIFVGGGLWLDAIGRIRSLYCRRNGRTFRIQRAKDKRWNLYRIATKEDAGVLLGTYEGRGVANKALAQIAYQPETSW
jgi:hypothetical protein